MPFRPKFIVFLFVYTNGYVFIHLTLHY